MKGRGESGVADVIDRLRGALSQLELSDRRRASFTGLPVMTHGFFPGGNGLWQGVDAIQLPVRGVLVLGSNFGSLCKFVNEQGKLVVLDERENTTWRPLRKILEGSGIDVEECFFTNAWPFLHYGDSNLGPVKKWLGDPDLMGSCVRFFEITLAEIMPRMIVALGTGPAAFLGSVWPEQLGQWRGDKISALDDLPMAPVCVENKEAICVAVTHPSMPNARHRRPPYRGRVGEVHLLSEALQKSCLING